MSTFVKKLRNPGTILSLVSLTVLLLNQLGYGVDSARVSAICQTLCSIGLIVGALNNPNTAGIDFPFINEETGDADPNDIPEN